MARKVFMSVLGTGFYSECTYVGVNTRTQTRFIQEATLNEIGAKGWNSEDSAYVFITDRSEIDNWIVKDNCRTNLRSKEIEQYNGLQKVLDDMSLPCTVESVKIKDGKDENEMWDIFNTIYGCIHDGDELYFDLTHAFRYLPMLVLVLGSYAKFLKNVKIAYISYGNFEVQCDEKPIMSLLSLNALLDWTSAAAAFVKTGRVSGVIENVMADVESSGRYTPVETTGLTRFVRNLEGFTNQIETCRGREIVAANAAIQIQNYRKAIRKYDVPQPLKMIIVNIIDMLQKYHSDSLDNLKSALQWCKRYQLIQQGYTLCQESIVTLMCKKFDNYNPYPSNTRDERRNSRKQYRDYWSSILGLPESKRENESDWRGSLVENRALTKAIFKLGWIDDVRGRYSQLAAKRNAVNHGGFIDNIPISDIVSEFGKTIDNCLTIFDKELSDPVVEDNLPKIFINYTNHPVKDWSEEQVSAAKKYAEELVDIPFIVIDPDKDEDDIEKIADSELKKILKVTEGHDATVHLMGEQTLSFSLIKKLQGLGVRCVASTTKREVKDLGDNKREVTFRFVKFREY